jgi:hypothetical protein
LSAGRFLIARHGGELWRPKGHGYTNSILEAGVFDAEKAAEYQDGRSNHSIAVPFDSSIADRIGRVLSECDDAVLAVVFDRLGSSQLMRASPDLLAACEALIARREQTEATHEDAYRFVFKGSGADLFDGVRAAIAKARGE